MILDRWKVNSTFKLGTQPNGKRVFECGATCCNPECAATFRATISISPDNAHDFISDFFQLTSRPCKHCETKVHVWLPVDLLALYHKYEKIQQQAIHALSEVS